MSVRDINLPAIAFARKGGLFGARNVTFELRWHSFQRQRQKVVSHEIMGSKTPKGFQVFLNVCEAETFLVLFLSDVTRSMQRLLLVPTISHFEKLTIEPPGCVTVALEHLE